MTPLTVIVVRAAGAGRAALVVASTAVACGLLLVGASILRFDDSDPRIWAQGHVFSPIADAGTRPGAAVAVLLLVLPILLLLDQAVRLGSTSRRRRFAGLAVAGATRADLRRWASLEVGLPAAAGAVLGVPLWLLLRELLGIRLAPRAIGALVPYTTGPGVWTLLVVAAVAAYGVLAGRRAGARMSEVLGGSHGVQPPPRPWAALLLVGAAAVLAVGYVVTFESSDGLSLACSLAAVLSGVAGMAGLAPWAAYRTARALSPRARSGAALIATGRLAADPRPAGRAAAAVGAVALTGGVLGVFVWDVIRDGDTSSQGEYLRPAAVVAGCAVVGMLVIATSLAVHSTETLVERRREMAALVATGVPPRVISSAQRLECLIATLPLTVAGSLVGGLGYGLLAGPDVPMLAWLALATVVTTAVVVTAVWGMTRVLRPWVLEAVDPEQLRTE